MLYEVITGWKEFEMEVMRDKNDNAIIVCSIENIDIGGPAMIRAAAKNHAHVAVRNNFV